MLSSNAVVLDDENLTSSLSRAESLNDGGRMTTLDEPEVNIGLVLIKIPRSERVVYRFEPDAIGERAWYIGTNLCR